jgi:hypothetical protein
MILVDACDSLTRSFACDVAACDFRARYMDPNITSKMRHHQIGADMSGFQWLHQSEILHPIYTDLFFENVRL